MGKAIPVISSVGAALLCASLAGNYYLFSRMDSMTGEKEAEKVQAQVQTATEAEETKPEEKEGEKAEKKYSAKLGETPILFRSAEVDDDGDIVLYFDSESSLTEATVSVSPEVNGSTYRLSGTRIWVYGNFKPGLTYRVTVQKGAVNYSGGKLEQDVAADVRIPDKTPDAGYLTYGTYLPLYGKKLVLPFRTVNKPEVNVTVYKEFENNLNPYFGEGYNRYSRMVEIAEKTLKLPAPKNREIYHELDLESLLGGRKPGVYRVELDGRTRYVSITDMAMQVTEDVAGGKVIVFVRSLKTGKPVAGADLAVMSYNNQIAASGKTDESGCAVLTYDPAWAKEEDRTVAVIARKEGDLSYFRLSDSHWNEAKYDGLPISKNEVRAFVFTERGISRPGETFTASAFLRQEKNGTFKIIGDEAVEFTLRDPNGNTVLRWNGKCSAAGFASCDFTLPDTAMTGVYDIACKVISADEVCGKDSIRIASYVPDRIKVSGKCLTEQAAINDILEFEFDAKYYFGADLENGSYNYYIYSVLGANPAHWDKSWIAGDKKLFTVSDRVSGHGTKTAGSVKVQFPGFHTQNGTAYNPVRVVAEFQAAEPGGRSVSGRAAKTLYPSEHFIGIREGKNNSRKKQIEFTLLPVKKDDTFSLPEQMQVTFELVRQEWEYAMTRSGDTWRRVWTERSVPLTNLTQVKTIPAGEYKTGTIHTAEWDLPSGRYILTASAGDNIRTATEFWHYAGDGGSRSASPSSIYFRTNAETAEPGKEFKFDFDAPGTGEAILVFGEKTIAGQKVIPVKAGRNEVTLTIPANIHSSSFFVGCTTLVKENNLWRRNFGVLTIPVDQTKAHKLKVALKHATEAETESEIPVTVTLTDAAGKPQSGAVALYAVDSGVISLTDYKAPDIFSYFYGKIPCPMTFYDMYDLLYEDLKITPDGRIGGDAAARKLGKIKQKQTARVIVPCINVPASGSATVQVKLPDHTGAMDFFAVASGEDGVGSADSNIIIRKPATVTISAPRYLAPGDTADLTVTVFNHTLDASAYTCKLSLPAFLEAQGNPVFTGKSLAKGGQQTMTLTVKAKEQFAPGKITADLTMGNVKAKDDTYITVRSVNVAQTQYRFTVLEPGQSLSLAFAGDFIGKTGGFIRLSASPALAVNSALAWLNEYPHGCLEQTTAGAFPFLALPELEKAGLIDADLAKSNQHKAAQAYAQILNMALSDGSFAMWQGGTTAWADASVFALHFIFEAEKKNKIKLESSARSRYLRWLRKQADNASPENRSRRAYAAYVLAVAGDKAFLTAARNIIQGAEKADYALFLAGGALVKGGYANLGTTPMKDALEGKCYLEDGVPTSYSDNACRLGMALYILMDCAVPGDELPAKLAFELAQMIRNDGGAWGTTQANAWASLGLSAYAAKYPPAPAAAQVTASGKSSVLRFPSVKTLPAVDGTAILNQSGGKLIVESTLTGIPRKTPANGGKLVLLKEYLNEKGESVTRVKHGDKVFVRIQLQSPFSIESVVVADLLPGGLEIEDELLASRSAMIPESMASKYGALHPKRMEKRDDRCIVYGDTEKGTSVITYQTRAVVRGEFVIPPVHAESMYQPDVTGIYGNMGSLTIE